MSKIITARCQRCRVVVWMCRIKRLPLRHDQQQGVLEAVESGLTVETVEDVSVAECGKCVCEVMG